MIITKHHVSITRDNHGTPVLYWYGESDSLLARHYIFSKYKPEEELNFFKAELRYGMNQR